MNSYSDRRQIAWPTATQTDNVRLNDDLKCNTIVCHTTQRLQRRTCPSTRNAKCCKRFICRSYCLSVPIEKCSKKQTTKESHEFRFCVLNAELQRTFFLQFFIHFIFIFFGFHIFVGEFLAVPMSAAIVFLVIYVSVCIFSASTEIWVCMILFFSYINCSVNYVFTYLIRLPQSLYKKSSACSLVYSCISFHFIFL